MSLGLGAAALWRNQTLVYCGAARLPTQLGSKLLISNKSKEVAKVAPSYQVIYAVVQRIPFGRVATYGQVADLAGLPRAARQVGYALNALRGKDESAGLPWHRVVNSQGKVSVRAEAGTEEYQQDLLMAEGVEFDHIGRLSLSEYRWSGETADG
ncbi:MAG: methylated-DNA-protein-cysteine methyltransferase-like protein [Gammaproteobacteria bacterium]|jgi:methylated-DNA-protein-cysteine methyltransferase-like protein